MLRSPNSETPMKFLSQPNLAAVSLTEEQEAIRNVNLRKRKNPEQDHLADMKEDLLRSFKEMMNTEIAVIKQQNSKLLESNAEIIKLLEISASNYKEISNRVQVIEYNHVAAIERINDLENELNVMQKQLLKNTVEIRNMPYAEKEQVHDIVKTIYNKLNLPAIEDKATVYRRGKNNGPIIIEYTDTKNKEVLLKAVKKYHSENKDKPLNSEILGIDGETTKIYISESLTPMSRKILAAARELVKNGAYKYCWVSRGNILLRKEDGKPAIVVKSLNQVRDLLSE